GSTSGNARKTTGSFYTPDSLVMELIKSALDPVIADRLAAQPDRPIDALLSITVCDPSCGSGHFLLAAARRLAEKLAELRAPDGAVRPDDYRHALREVASHCLYGVDINPMAVELCRVALWLETVDPGKPLGFLNHHIRTGNSLLGTTPDLIAAGLPDDTFTAIEGDDKPACAELKKRNKKEREGFGPLFKDEEEAIREHLRQAATAIEAMDDSQPAALQQKEAAFTTSETAPEYRHAKLLADLWCAAFVIKKVYPVTEGEAKSAPSPNCDLPSPIEGHLLHTDDDLFGQPTPAADPKPAASKPPRTKNQEQGTAWGITTAHLRDFVQGKPLPTDLQTEVEAHARQYRFFHWHLAFPQVFDQGGFDCILGNPPWERVKLQEKEWFAEQHPEISNAKSASDRKKLIAALKAREPKLFQQFLEASRVAEGESHLLRNGGRFPLCGRGDINLYAVFAEQNRLLLSNTGRVGCVLPSGIASDDTTKLFFQDLIETESLVSFFDFENKELLFAEVAPVMKFCLLVAGSGKQPIAGEALFIFFAHKPEDLLDIDRVFTLTPADIELLNPNTRTCPIFRSKTDAVLTKHIYRRVPVLKRSSGTPQDPWGIRFSTLFHMSNDSGEFRTFEQLHSNGWRLSGNHFCKDDKEYLPLYEAKLFHQFNHRPSTFEGVAEADRFKMKAPTNASSPSSLNDPDYAIFPRFWVASEKVEDVTSSLPKAKWFIAFRGMTNVMTNSRNAVFSVIPKVAVGNSAPVCVIEHPDLSGAFLASLNSFVLDYSTRQKLAGANMNFFIVEQLPVLPPATYAQPCPWANDPESQVPTAQSLRDWLLPRVLELTYTAWDLEAFAADCGWSGPPFRWDEERRFLLRCELDAAFFHLYLGPQTEWQQQPEALTRAFPTPRHAVSYIMDTFPIVKRKDEAKHHGHYRTKETILQIYDALGEAMRTGVTYQTRLDPLPASLRVAHRPRLPQEDRVALTQARAYWLELLVAVARLSGDEFTLEQLWEAYLIILSAPDLATEAESVLGDATQEWLSSLATEPAEPGLFADMLEALNANGQLTRMKVGGQIRLTLSADIPVQPDAWRNYDAAAALTIYQARPAAVKLETTTQKPAVRREVARYEILERKFA
ncbi:MAG TPA: N-6 DNA methylase, partial [Prosthecobacter sp.]|nr:N-6 DNA methylase [Prosthecobacter sp.]